MEQRMFEPLWFDGVEGGGIVGQWSGVVLAP